MTTETQPLIKRLRRGWLSSAQWFHEHKSLKLTSRIADLRKDPAIKKKLIQRTVKRNGKSFCEYRLG